jgi:hypothetical protein
MATKNTKVIVMLPYDGEPYILDEELDEDNDGFLVQACVHGWMEPLNLKHVYVKSNSECFYPIKGKLPVKAEVYVNELAGVNKYYRDKPNKHIAFAGQVMLGDAVIILSPLGPQKYCKKHAEFLDEIKLPKRQLDEYTFDNFDCFKHWIGKDVVDKDKEGWMEQWKENHMYG